MPFLRAVNWRERERQKQKPSFSEFLLFSLLLFFLLSPFPSICRSLSSLSLSRSRSRSRSRSHFGFHINLWFRCKLSSDAVFLRFWRFSSLSLSLFSFLIKNLVLDGICSLMTECDLNFMIWVADAVELGGVDDKRFLIRLHWIRFLNFQDLSDFVFNLAWFWKCFGCELLEIWWHGLDIVVEMHLTRNWIIFQLIASVICCKFLLFLGCNRCLVKNG